MPVGSPAFAKAPRQIRTFDIVCRVSGHTYRVHHPELEGQKYAMPQSWVYDFRYQIDLNNGTYLEVPSEGEMAMKIASTTRRIITFVKKKDVHETFNLKTRRYRHTAVLSEWKEGFAAGPCRYAKFSGHRPPG
jgi:hypothetical protein